jgi:hypothetical protein
MVYSPSLLATSVYVYVCSYVEVCCPLAIVTLTNGAWESIDQAFNGAGYIGHHAFVLPGLSFLRAEGKNIDGTLASTKYTRSVLSIIELTNSNKCISINSGTGVELLTDYITVQTYNDLITDYSAVGRTLQYVIDDNMAYRMAAASPHRFAATRRTVLVRYYYDGASVTQFDIEPVISVLSQKDICSKSMNPVGLSGTINLPVNTHNFISPTGAVTIALPINVSNTITNEIELQVRQTSAIAFTFDSNILWGGEGTPDMSVGLWDIIFTWIQGANKLLGSYKKWTNS